MSSSDGSGSVDFGLRFFNDEANEGVESIGAETEVSEFGPNESCRLFDDESFPYSDDQLNVFKTIIVKDTCQIGYKAMQNQ